MFVLLCREERLECDLLAAVELELAGLAEPAGAGEGGREEPLAWCCSSSARLANETPKPCAVALLVCNDEDGRALPLPWPLPELEFDPDELRRSVR